MPLNRRLYLAIAVLIAAAGVGGFLTVSWLWCASVSYEDTQMRPLGTTGAFVPPPGPIYLDPDGYYWLSYAQRIGRGEDWRVRYTMMDNFPAGREVHWSQVASWSMVALGKVRACFTHEALATAIEKASVAMNPLLFLLASVGLFVAMASQFGMLPSALFLAFLCSLGDVVWIFQPLRPGHQGFHVVFGAASVLGLLFGGMGLATRQTLTGERWPLFQTPHPVDLPTARRWFTLAGIGTGLALWVAATIECFFVYPMIGIFVVLLVLVPPGRVTREDLAAHPELWRRWGWTAGAVGFAFYLIEYFPHHMAMRMEVNHPLYDLAMVGVGEGLRSLTMWRWRADRRTPMRLALAVLLLALGVLPLVLVKFGPVAWHHMRDPEMLRLHNFIQEFYTYNNLVKTNRLGHFFATFGVLPIFFLLAPLFMLRRRLSATQMIWLWCPFVYACSFGVLAFLQVRWMGFFASAACLGAFVVAHFIYTLLPPLPSGRAQFVAIVAALTLLAQPANLFYRAITTQLRDLSGDSMEEMSVPPILDKRIACAMKASPACPKAIIADPSFAPSFEYFTGVPCLTSFYWENTEGLHQAVRFFTTKNPDEAHRIATDLGATHVILSQSWTMPDYLYFVAYGHYDTAALETTFAAKIIRGKTPAWLQPDLVLNPITTNPYSYRGHPVAFRLEAFHIQE